MKRSPRATPPPRKPNAGSPQDRLSLPAPSDTAENRAAVEAWRDRLARLNAEAEAADRAAAQSAAKATGAEATARDQETLAVPAGGRTLPLAFATVAIALGIVFTAAGLLIAPAQPLVAALGAVVLVLGIVGLAIALVRRPQKVAAAPMSTEVARLRSDAEGARVLADSTAQQLETAKAEWRAWLAERSLGGYGEDASAVRQLLDDLRARDELVAEVARHRAAAARERDAAEAWVVRLVDLVRSFDDSAGQIPQLSSATELASRARFTLGLALKAREERASVERDAAVAEAARRNLVERARLANASIVEIAATYEIDPTDPLPVLKTAAAALKEERSSAAEAYEVLADEHSALRGRLNNDGRDDRMIRARQALEGLQARAADGR